MKKVNSKAVEEVFGVNEVLGDGPLMDNYTAVAIAEGFEEAENEEQVLRAWQHLHNTRLAYQLQGWFGVRCQQLVNAGLIHA